MHLLTKDELNEIYSIRRDLHKYPELSGNEKRTAQALEKFISEYKPSAVIRNIGGYGIAFVFGSNNDNPTIMFRADMDALPIRETNNFNYRSVYDAVGHNCGHDGHMAILCGLAMYLHKNPVRKGRVILLFQPEEETGKGALKVLADPKFQKLNPGYVFALHNLPGFELNTIQLSNEIFASASTGIIVNFEGRSSHAAHPEQGNSPAKLTAELILELENIPENNNAFKDFTLVTIIHAKIGEVAFGTNPGKAQLMATLRTFRNDDMEKLKEIIEKLIKEKSEKKDIRYSINYTEEFPSTVNDNGAMQHLVSSVRKYGFDEIWIDKPFKWSEDFGNFAHKYKSVLFGIGAGKDHPSLHNSDYDFPEQIIKTGVDILAGVLDSFWEKP